MRLLRFSAPWPKGWGLIARTCASHPSGCSMRVAGRAVRPRKHAEEALVATLADPPSSSAPSLKPFRISLRSSRARGRPDRAPSLYWYRGPRLKPQGSR